VLRRSFGCLASYSFYLLLVGWGFITLAGYPAPGALTVHIFEQILGEIAVRLMMALIELLKEAA